jgi:hypothetical protein
MTQNGREVKHVEDGFRFDRWLAVMQVHNNTGHTLLAKRNEHASADNGHCIVRDSVGEDDVQRNRECDVAERGHGLNQCKWRSGFGALVAAAGGECRDGEIVPGVVDVRSSGGRRGPVNKGRFGELAVLTSTNATIQSSSNNFLTCCGRTLMPARRFRQMAIWARHLNRIQWPPGSSDTSKARQMCAPRGDLQNLGGCTGDYQRDCTHNRQRRREI